jgi:hypothetical protein
MLKGIFSVCFFFYPSTNRCPSLWDSIKPPWSLWLNLCLKFSCRLMDLTDTCMCGVQRWGSHSKIMFNTIIAHRVSPWNLFCDLLSTFLLLKLFRLAIKMGLNTYWFKTFQLFIFYSFVKMSNVQPLFYAAATFCLSYMHSHFNHIYMYILPQSAWLTGTCM